MGRVESAEGPVFFVSDRLEEAGFVHAFTTRIGGVSRGPYASLNLASLKKEAGDDNTAVAENFRRVRRALGATRWPRFAPRQVHGRDLWVTPAKPVARRDVPAADAVVSERPGQLLVVRTADCVPVLLGDTGGTVAAAVHAGWRGLVAGVIEATVARIDHRFGIEARSLVAAIGPCIGVARYEVGPEVAEAFVAAGFDEAVDWSRGDRPHVSIAAAAGAALVRAGVNAGATDSIDTCTFEDDEQFFSYRRDGAPTGRMAALIGRRPQTGFLSNAPRGSSNESAPRIAR